MEYEDRRDADDAYHDMHNKRIGRDDVLKIEVCCRPHFSPRQVVYGRLTRCSGLALPPLLRGGSTAEVSVNVGRVALPRAVGHPALAAATIPQGRTIVATVTGTGITTATAATPATGHAALTGKA